MTSWGTTTVCMCCLPAIVEGERNYGEHVQGARASVTQPNLPLLEDISTILFALICRQIWLEPLGIRVGGILTKVVCRLCA